MKILLLDNAAPWVVSLFEAVAAQGHAVRAIRPQSLGTLGLSGGSPPSVIVPGWTRFTNLSTMIVARTIGRLLREQPDTDAIVYTLPQYAGIAERIVGPLCAYYAFDPYLSYDWNPGTTKALERRMLERADAVFAISEALSEDFRSQTKTPVVTCGNAVSRSFIERMRQPPPMPPDLPKAPRPMVGCTGQINRSYDWDLVDTLARELPDISFVFIGPIVDEPSPLGERIKSVLQMPNVHWLGPKPHEQLPDYLAGFDICFNPLLVNEYNDRRSPLRLYDYLATDKPILSTPIREAQAHRPFVETGQTAQQCATILRQFAGGQYDCRLTERRRYIGENTWENRASLLLQTLRTTLARPAES